MATARMTLGCAVCALLPAYATVALAEEASSAPDVRVSVDGKPSRPMREGEALPSGSLVSTGAAPRVVLRFPDGQRVLLGPRTQLRIVDYRFGPEAPQADRALFELAAGTARFAGLTERCRRLNARHGRTYFLATRLLRERASGGVQLVGHSPRPEVTVSGSSIVGQSRHSRSRA